MIEEVFSLQAVEAAPRGEVKRRFKTPDPILRRLLAAGDALSIVSALGVAAIAGEMSDRGGQLLWGVAAIPLFLLIFKLYGLYDRDVKRVTHSTVDDLPWLFHATLVGGLLLWLYAKYTPMADLDFVEVLSFGVGLLVIAASVRFVVRSAVARHIVSRDRALILGTGDVARTLVSKIANHPEYRLDIVGSLDAHSAARNQPPVAPILGRLDDLEAVVQRFGITRVMLSARDLEEEKLEEVLLRCRAGSLKVSILPRLADMVGPGLEVDDVEGVAVLGVNPPWLPRSSRALKRGMDILLAGVLLLLSAPLIALLALAVRIDSRGPVFFSQTRVGRNGRRFRLHKFRTMSPDAEQRRTALLAQSTDPHWLKLEHDPRITRIGRYLRRLSLDELPQLWNVLRGEMSMVGPRPLIESEDERVEGWARGRLDLTPGLTGYWQVLGRTRIPFEEMVKLDYLYVMNWSLWEDVRLMLRTLPIVAGGRGAN
ncbi:MAG TPA: exopolysaccharide biosynthesis polyprenyl glycosylphosphotransferase [Solirubrobacteraceae bacterium]|nr:exopolysaccharide biosynthesis polyprenyl glycosylphosphotransferase [Solirubrobacteraceae bacterium]